MGGAGQLGQPMAAGGGQLGQSTQPIRSSETAAPVNSSGQAAMPHAPTMQPTQTTPQPLPGAFMGGGALSSASAPNQVKSPGMTQAKFGGS